MKETKARTPEYLSKDILDEDFVKTFVIFNRLQFILGSCRIEVKDQFVTSPTRYQKCYTVLCILLTVLLNYVVVTQFYGDIRDDTIYRLSVAALWASFGIFLFQLTNARFFNGQANADFFIRMQKVDRLMGLNRNKGVNLILKKVNIISMVLLLSAFSIMLVAALFKKPLKYLPYVGAIYCQLTGLIELNYCSNLMIYFVLRLRFTNSIIKNHLTQKKKKILKPDSYNYFANRNLKKLALQTHNFPTSDTNVYLKELFDLFAMFQNLYRFQLFLFCLKLVLESLFVFGLILFSIQKNTADFMELFSMFAFAVIDIFIAIFIGVRLQMFFDEVKETKRLSIAVMAAYSSGQLREKARKMLRLADETPPRLSIYDMYDMDAGIFLSVFSLITSLIVTLLQFAFL